MASFRVLLTVRRPRAVADGGYYREVAEDQGKDRRRARSDGPTRAQEGEH